MKNLPAIIASIQANLAVWIPLIVVILSSLATGLSNYPQASGVVAAIQQVLSFISVVTHKDAPNTFKVPLTPHAALPVVGATLKEVK